MSCTSEIQGLIILDKPAGPASREVVEQIRKMIGAKTAGHVGTLDPRATGVLPVLLGRAARVARALERMDKEYIAVVHLHKDVADSVLHDVLKRFVGTVVQRPPVKSAVARIARERRIYSIDIIGREGRDVKLRIRCEAGTYIRKLASDIGSVIGGAHLRELRRTRSGPFDEKQAHGIEELYAALRDSGLLRRIVLPVEAAVAHLPSIVIKDPFLPDAMRGAPISASGIAKANGTLKMGALVAVLSTEGELLALGRAMAEDATKKGTVVRVDRIVKALCRRFGNREQS